MPYCTRSDVESIFGTENVAQWADLDNDQDATNIATRIADAILDADAYIDDQMRMSQYAIPLANSSAQTPRSIKRLSAAKAGLLLYEARGSMDVNEVTGAPIHRYAARAKEIDRMLDLYKSDRAGLDAVRTGPHPPTFAE